MANKLMTAKDVVASIKDGMTIGIGGWGQCGTLCPLIGYLR